MGGIEVIDPRFRPVFERAVEVLGSDDRVIAVHPSGSVGTGTADAWSDLDLQVITDPGRHDEFLADWPAWLEKITPTVFARTPIAPFVINAVTDEGLTLDLAIYPGEVPEWPAPRKGWTVGQLSPVRMPLGDALEYAVAEQLRGMAGPFISLVKRDEHLRHLAGVSHLLGLLTTVFLAETGREMPGKHWNRTFTEEQRAAVAALPPASATREGMIAFGLGSARLVIERARPLFPDFDLTWPADLAAVVARRIDEQLGIDVSAWLY